MKYEITTESTGVDVHVDDLRDHRDQVMAVFDRCREGNCPCPAAQIDIETTDSDDGVTVHLRSRDGGTFDTSVIERCLGKQLRHTE